MSEKQARLTALKLRSLGTACVLLWCAMMGATLWPFNPLPHNEVNWLGTTDGIHIEPKGMVVSSAPFVSKSTQTPPSFTIEILLRIENEYRVNTILSFYSAGSPEKFHLRQYNNSLIINRDFPDKQIRRRSSEIDVGHIFNVTRPTLVTITSSKQGTDVYADGELVETSGEFKLSEKDLSGNLIAGTSPVDFDPWSGDLLSMALYGRELSELEIKKHSMEWKKGGTIPFLETENPIAIYSFGERAGKLIRNEVALQPDLHIPDHFYLPAKPILRAPWNEFSADWHYVADILRNIAGFIPLGIFFYLYFSSASPSSRAALLTIALGATTSLVIEILQAFIPQRLSGMTDIITNTLGTMLGILLLQARPIRGWLVKLGLPIPAWSKHGRV
jgi:hypothetical protein